MDRNGAQRNGKGFARNNHQLHFELLYPSRTLACWLHILISAAIADLNSLESCLNTFHRHKEIVIELEICEHFNIPKLHLLLHYINCICSLGSADGYNMKSPECLHINFVKEAYCVSNKRDYVEKMVIWLQRHEAMWLQESYLIWVEKRLLSMIWMSEDSMMEEEEDVQVQLINSINVTQHVLNANQRDINITDSLDKNLNKFNNTMTYSLAKWPPHPNLTIEKLAQKFSTTNFLLPYQGFFTKIYRVRQ